MADGKINHHLFAGQHHYHVEEIAPDNWEWLKFDGNAYTLMGITSTLARAKEVVEEDLKDVEYAGPMTWGSYSGTILKSS